MTTKPDFSSAIVAALRSRRVQLVCKRCTGKLEKAGKDGRILACHRCKKATWVWKASSIGAV